MPDQHIRPAAIASDLHISPFNSCFLCTFTCDRAFRMYSMKQKILEYLRNGDTSGAIQALLSGLNSNAVQSAQALKVVRLLEAEFNRLREEQLQNTIDSDTAEARINSINKRLLDILDLLEAPHQSALPSKSNKTPYLLAALVGLAVLGFIAWKLFQKPPPPPVTPPVVQKSVFDCPAFDTSLDLRIVIVPFLNLTQEADVPLHIGLQDEINALIRKIGYPGTAAVIKGDPTKNYLTFDDAEALRDSCSTDLIVWGKYSASASGGNAYIDVRYVSQPVVFQQEEDVDSLLEHRNQAELSSNLKTVATLLLAQAFLGENRADLSLALARQITQSSAPGTEKLALPEAKTTTSDAHLIMAEAYQMLEQPEKAVESYEEALRLKPDNKTALTNKAVLDFKAKRLEAAEDQTDKILETHPDQIKLHLLKAKIYEERGEPVKAKEAIKTFTTELKEKEIRDSLKTEVRKPRN